MDKPVQAPDYIEGADFIKWCRAVSVQAFLLAQRYGPDTAEMVCNSRYSISRVRYR